MLKRLGLLVVGLLAAGLVSAAPAFAAAPTITAVSPASGPLNAQFTVTGTGFTPAAQVTVGGVAARAITVVSGVKITHGCR